MSAWERDATQRIAALDLTDGKYSTHRIGKPKSQCNNKTVR
jgi:hypothetical protein